MLFRLFRVGSALWIPMAHLFRSMILVRLWASYKIEHRRTAPDSPWDMGLAVVSCCICFLPCQILVKRMGSATVVTCQHNEEWLSQNGGRRRNGNFSRNIHDITEFEKSSKLKFLRSKSIFDETLRHSCLIHGFLLWCLGTLDDHGLCHGDALRLHHQLWHADRHWLRGWNPLLSEVLCLPERFAEGIPNKWFVARLEIQIVGGS